MEFGICLQCVIPARAEPSHSSEMVTQILFGELLRILSFENEWANVEMAYDDYQGWIPVNQLQFLTEKEFLQILNSGSAITSEIVQLVSNQTRQTIFPIITGSSLPGYVNGEFKILEEKYFFDGEVKTDSLFESLKTRTDLLRAKQEIVTDAMLYLNAPYLWGGRTPFGIDCSGFTQIVFKKNKVRLLRDADQQAQQGETLSFLSETEPGDLAFFDNPDGKIIHVGILINPTRIIHASGKVRIDSVDHQGIFNSDEQAYTHNLRVIKRMV